MYFVQVTLAIVLVTGYASAVGYGPGSGSGSAGSYGGSAGTSAGGYGAGAGSGGAGGYSVGASAGGYSGSSGSSSGFGGSSVSYGGGASSFGGAAAGIQNVPQPYNFDYQAQDEQGNTHYRNEQGDQNGNVQGSYGYTDVQGLYRVVEYVADANGFRANIRTNEPGTDSRESPADVVLVAEPAPAGIQERYTSFGGRGQAAAKPSGVGGYSGGQAGSGVAAGGYSAGSAGSSSGFPTGQRLGGGARPSGKSGY
ncbi:keratin, type I cytoskeletal 9-like [Stegodyphus dumicola]|uniref:keratin, type I cytoskeletal 9-like n=1 Tax=Stegodyphus dumicola TaxID=202533 RepID=UPI0015B00AE2|nr:keratin, type I cytoskeletal 9-like [Stegodyphus dumicola]